MSKTFSAYIVVRDNDATLFSQKVQAKLNEGWLCRGKMQTQRAGSYVFDYLQNMVKL
jgi:hypothetical protein